MIEQHYQQDQEPEITGNVVSFHVPVRRSEPMPTDEELAEYRRLRPILRAMAERWPSLLAEHEAITGNCVLARKILAGDP